MLISAAVVKGELQRDQSIDLLLEGLTNFHLYENNENLLRNDRANLLIS